MSRGWRAHAVSTALVLAAAACGGTSGGSEAQPAATLPAGSSATLPSVTDVVGTTSVTGDPLAVRPESAASSLLPDIVVRHVQTGDEVQLKNLLPAAKPLLVWFWAPH